MSVPGVPQFVLALPFYGLYDYCVLKAPMPRGGWTTCHILPPDTIVKHVECVGNHQMILTKR